MMKIIFTLIFCFLSCVAHSAESRFEWEAVLPVLTSAEVSLTSAKLISSSALSWPDGRSALISYWQDKDIIRCVDYKNANFQDTGSMCYKSVKK